VAIKTEKGLQS